MIQLYQLYLFWHPPTPPPPLNKSGLPSYISYIGFVFCFVFVFVCFCFCFVLFCFCFVVFCFVFVFVLFCHVLFCFVLFCFPHPPGVGFGSTFDFFLFCCCSPGRRSCPILRPGPAMLATVCLVLEFDFAPLTLKSNLRTENWWQTSAPRGAEWDRSAPPGRRMGQIRFWAPARGAEWDNRGAEWDRSAPRGAEWDRFVFERQLGAQNGTTGAQNGTDQRTRGAEWDRFVFLAPKMDRPGQAWPGRGHVGQKSFLISMSPIAFYLSGFRCWPVRPEPAAQAGLSKVRQALFLCFVFSLFCCYKSPTLKPKPINPTQFTLNP